MKPIRFKRFEKTLAIMITTKFLILFLVLILWNVNSVKLTSETFGSWHDDYGPWVKGTEGEPWPSPKIRHLNNNSLVVNATIFQFRVTGDTCDVIEEAIARYRSILLSEARIGKLFASDRSMRSVRSDTLPELNIELKNPCSGTEHHFPYLHMNETYVLKITADNYAKLAADTVWGILRGIETFSQLLMPNGDGSTLTIQCQYIEDVPKFPHRGLLLDTSRHYLPLSDVQLTLDAMSYNKLNVLHWHIVDDNSFPYQSTTYPELSDKGAYNSRMVYTPSDVREVINYARLRGIRVIPEFDTPGHTKSWGRSHPDLLTTCYDADGKPNGRLGPMNPFNPKLYEFLENLFLEVSQVFPDKYIHLGGDEVPFECWASNPDIIAYMKARNMSGEYARLENEYIQNLLRITNSLKSDSIVWQEVFENHVVLPNETIVHVWIGNDWQLKMREILESGYPALLSACWYLDSVGSGGDWEKYYACDPLSFGGSDDVEIASRLLGGEACMWGEFVDSTNIHPRIWPRATAAAEKLWSFSNQNMSYVRRRLEEHACRMKRRGVPTQPPNGSGYCIV